MSEENCGNFRSNHINCLSSTNKTSPSTDDWNKAIQILHRYKQNNFSEIYELNTFKQSITHRFLLTDLDTFDDYLQLLENSIVEKDLLYDLLIPTRSQFFLNPEAWQSLEKIVIPQLMAVEQRPSSARITSGDLVPPTKEISCWVAGCGTGEEAYSLAMLLHETILAKTPDRKIKIIATDISSTALKASVKGVYDRRIAKVLGQERLDKYFIKQNNNFSVNYKLRKLVSFVPHNLIRPIGFTNIDLICCRNTLIYFKPQYKNKALLTLISSLVPQGFLFLGNKEPLEENDNCTRLDCPGTIFQKLAFDESYIAKENQLFSKITVNKFNLQHIRINSAVYKLKGLESELESTQINLQNTTDKLPQELAIIKEIDREVITANTNIKKINQELYSINQARSSQIEILKELNSDLENLLRSIDIGVIFLDRQLKIHKYNSSAQKIINFRATDIGRPIKDLKHNLDCTNLVEILEQFLQTECPEKLEVKNLQTKEILLMKLHYYCVDSQQRETGADGSWSTEGRDCCEAASQCLADVSSQRVSPHVAKHRVPVESNFPKKRNYLKSKSSTQTCEGIILTFVDISDRKQAEQTLLHQAFYDSLTGLPNRLLFKEKLQHALHRLSRQNARSRQSLQRGKPAQRAVSPFLAVLYLDLNGFKEVNDSLGHQSGDLLLIEVGHRLNEVVRSNDTVSRLGGDEFAILLEEIHSPEQSLEIASRIHQTLARYFSIESRQITISTSIGVAIHSQKDNLSGSIETLMENADMAMYRAKRRGVAETEIFSPQMRESAETTMKMKNQLSLAFDRQEFVLQYQPVFGLKDGTLQGFEALVRWIYPGQSVIYPNAFLPLLQDSSLLFQLERWIIKQACEQLYQWKEQFDISPDFSLGINISPLLLANDNFLDYLDEILDGKQTITQYLTLELTETALIQNSETVEDTLRQLRLRGIKIALDDFGTGFSSLSHLHRFPLDIIKIDCSFVLSLFQNERSGHIVRSIIFMSQQMNLTPIAEGIENIESLQWLQKHHCQLGQGHFWSPSLMPTAATNLLLNSIDR